MKITIDVKYKATQARLKKIGKELTSDMSPAMKEIGQKGSIYFAGVAFQTKGQAFNKPWKPLSPVTRQFKTKNFPGRADMVQTSSIRESFGFESDDGSVYLKNTDPKFKYHQSKQTRDGKLPRRVMIGVNATLKTIIKKAVRKNVVLIIKENS